jgi:hypothetical protein
LDVSKSVGLNLFYQQIVSIFSVGDEDMHAYLIVIVVLLLPLPL